MAKYQQYDEYKDSGVEWLGEIPNSWQTGSLRWMIDIASGESLPSNCEKEYSKENQFPVVGGNGVMGFSNKVNTADAAIAVGRVGALCGNIHSIDYDSWITDNALKISKWNKFSKDFLVYLLKTAHLNDLASKTAQPLITGEQVKSLKVVLLPIAEQKKIANFLDFETAQIDTLIEKQQALIQLLKEKRQAVISHAVTKGLNPDAPMKDSGVEWLGEVPEHWDLTRIKYITSVFEQGWSPQCDSRPAEENEYGVLKVGCVNHGKFNVKENKALPPELSPKLQYLIYKNDLLISRANTKELVGSAAVVDDDYDNILLCDKLYRLRFIPEINPRLVSFYLSIGAVREQIELQASGASHSMQNISQDVIKEMPCFFLSKEESKSILAFIDKQTEVFDSLINNAQKAIQLMQERRTALISAAVTGKIDVRGWRASE